MFYHNTQVDIVESRVAEWVERSWPTLKCCVFLVCECTSVSASSL